MLYFTEELLIFMTSCLLNYNKVLLTVLFHFSLSVGLSLSLSLYHCTSLRLEFLKIVLKDVIELCWSAFECVCRYMSVCLQIGQALFLSTYKAITSRHVCIS